MVAPYTVSGTIVDVHAQRAFRGRVHVNVFGHIERIEERDDVVESQFILPGLVDSHVHVESSMLMPSEFARAAVRHGVVAAVCDPHEIANVLGTDGIHYFIENGRQSKFKFFFGAPSCVPTAAFETSGATIDATDIAALLQEEDIHFLGELMNFPGVVHGDAEVLAKIAAAKAVGKPVDGHAPGLSGPDLKKYVAAGISTDHECVDVCEAEEKIALGMKILIREGSAAKNFNALYPLIRQFPSAVMLCTDDTHPDDLQVSYIDGLVRRGLAKDIHPFSMLQVASKNPVEHYRLPVGLLREGDAADFIVTDTLDEHFEVLQTYIAGRLVYDRGEVCLPRPTIEIKNNFHAQPVSVRDLEVTATGPNMRVIEVIDKELYTKSFVAPVKTVDGKAVADVGRDILKLVVLNRYESGVRPAVAFIRGFGLTQGALCSTVAHDSHNLIAVGTDDESIVKAMNVVIAAKGGIAVCTAQACHVMPLPIAGIISNQPIEEVASAYEALHREAKEVAGSPLTAPFMTLAFMSLIVIPELKLCDKGLFDVQQFNYTDLFCE